MDGGVRNGSVELNLQMVGKWVAGGNSPHGCDKFIKERNIDGCGHTFWMSYETSNGSFMEIVLIWNKDSHIFNRSGFDL